MRTKKTYFPAYCLLSNNLNIFYLNSVWETVVQDLLLDLCMMHSSGVNLTLAARVLFFVRPEEGRWKKEEDE